MQQLKSTLVSFWRLALPYFKSEDKWRGRILLGAVIIGELLMVALSVMLNWWNARFYNALQERDWNAFVYELTFFCVLATTNVLIGVYKLYLNQWLQIRWRNWLTKRYLGEWLNGANHYRMQLQGDSADNPDQRMTEDVEQFVERTLVIGGGLLNSSVTLFSFVFILWSLSAAAPLTIGGQEWSIPGYLVWGALFYAIFGTFFTHLIGKPLVNLYFSKQRYEADFRFNLVRVRENSEQIALLGGDTAERGRLIERFGRVVANWLQIMIRTKKLTFFTLSYSQAAAVFPFILAAPAYFASKVQLGGLMQTASAFGSVQESLSFFVSAYRSLAEWRSIVIRLEGFEHSIVQAEALARGAAKDREMLHVVPDGSTPAIGLASVALTLPNGKPLVGADGIALKQGEDVLVTGPSGSGKSTLFRAIAGIWPFGKGKVTIPANATLMMLPQRPYFPIGSLKAAIAYPAAEDTFDEARLKQALADVGLPALASQLHEDGHWNRTLSLGEQQRLGVARALLHAPDYLFLDEATASLDEPSEEKLYRLIEEKLPATTVISIGHRSTLAAFHNRGLVVTPSETTASKFTLQEAMA